MRHPLRRGTTTSVAGDQPNRLPRYPQSLGSGNFQPRCFDIWTLCGIPVSLGSGNREHATALLDIPQLLGSGNSLPVGIAICATAVSPDVGERQLDYRHVGRSEDDVSLLRWGTTIWHQDRMECKSCLIPSSMGERQPKPGATPAHPLVVSPVSSGSENFITTPECEKAKCGISIGGERQLGLDVDTDLHPRSVGNGNGMVRILLHAQSAPSLIPPGIDKLFLGTDQVY